MLRRNQYATLLGRSPMTVAGRNAGQVVAVGPVRRVADVAGAIVVRAVEVRITVRIGAPSRSQQRVERVAHFIGHACRQKAVELVIGGSRYLRRGKRDLIREWRAVVSHRYRETGCPRTLVGRDTRAVDRGHAGGVVGDRQARRAHRRIEGVADQQVLCRRGRCAGDDVQRRIA